MIKLNKINLLDINMSTISINHISLIISDCNQSKDFYSQVLGLECDKSRPDLNFPGLWYQLGSQQIHMLQVDNPYANLNTPTHGGRDRHLALNINNLEQIKTILEKKNIPYTASKSGRKAVFFRDPDNNVLELIES